MKETDDASLSAVRALVPGENLIRRIYLGMGSRGRCDGWTICPHSKSTAAILVFLVIITLTGEEPVPADNYAGDEACRSCHQQEFAAHLGTAHHLTSRLADEHSILGKFTPDANILKTSNPELFFRMDATPHGFFQTAVEGI